MKNWVRAWYAAPSRVFSAHLSGRTLRQILHLHAGGEQLRLHLSNRYGEEAVTLSSISVGKVLQGAVLSLGECDVSFEGRSTIRLEPGQEMVSDPVPLRVEAFSDLAITFFLAQGEGTTAHWGALQTSYVSGIGNATTVPAETAFFAYPLLTTSWWLLSGVDVLPAIPLNAVVTFGSSTTDGAGSTPNVNRRWPDELARRLRDAGGTRFMSVINAGLSGNQLTSSEIPQAGGMKMPPFLLGEAGSQRFAWDVMEQSGATDLIINIGANDLRFGISGDRVIEGLQQIVTQARTRYKKIFGTTILPGGYLPSQVKQRRRVNAWMCEEGSRWFDAVFDFAMPLASPDDEAVLHPAYDSGDGIHPNDEGYRMMAQAVDLSTLTGSQDPSA
ncbi:GDSL-type esterase/lipase family protein [Ktedonospora formicarum]|nr:GDSL-type esterase/lipase family protein [Ktedonospora formicarum]